jgi:large subunit ribosomal protein L10
MAHTSAIQLKEKQVKELVEKIKKSKTLMLVSVKGLPSRQFQEIKKSIRDDAFVKITRKNIISRAIQTFGKESILPLKDHITSDIAVVISDKDGYDLARIIGKKKTKVFAKAGQIANEDIEIKDGPTDLVPGPAISELGALGLQISVENGKIAIKASKVIVKQGEAIKDTVAAVLQKLNIQPFSVGLIPLVIYDVPEEKIYTHITIDSDGYTDMLKTAAAKSLHLARKINFYCKETMGYLLAKAHMHAKHIQNKSGGNA